MNNALPKLSPFDLRGMWRRFVLEWVVTVTALLGIAIVMGWMWKIDRDNVEEHEKDRLTTTATIIERNAVEQLESINKALLGFIARFGQWQKSSDGLVEANNYFDSVTEAMLGVDILFYADKEGVMRAAASSWRQYLGRSLSDRTYFKAFKESGSSDLLFISEPLVAISGDYTMSVSRAIVGANGEFNGIVVAGLEAQQYRTLLNSTLYAKDMWVSIAHGSGIQFMMEPDREGQAGLQLNRPDSLFVKHMASGERQNVMKGISTSTGQERLAVIRTIILPDVKLAVPLVLAVSRDPTEIFRSSNDLRQNFLLIFLFMLLGGAGSLALNQSIRMDAARSAWRARKEIEERDDALRRFFSLNVDLFAILSDEGKYKRINEAWSVTLGYPADFFVGQAVGLILHPEDKSKTEDYFQKLVDGAPAAGLVTRIRHAEGHYLEVEWRALQSGDQIFLSGRDVTAEQERKREIQRINKHLEEQRMQLQEMAFHDGLTDVYNRRYFDEVLVSEWRACLRDGKRLAALMIDVDHFKIYNDTYGHQQGDECLKSMAHELRSRFKRPRDLVARYGGEEFVALLSDTDEAGAFHTTTQVVQAIEAMRIPNEHSSVVPFVTVSIGVAVLVPTNDYAPEYLVELADSALYTAKSSGRNRAVMAGSRGAIS